MWRPSVEVCLEAWKKPPVMEPVTTGLGKEGGGLGCCSVTQCIMSNLKVPGSSDTRKRKTIKKKRMLEEALSL